MRWRDKNGIQDLLKAQHFLEKYIELVEGNSPNKLPKELMVAQSDDAAVPTIDPDWECMGNVGTNAVRGMYRCLKCGFRITARDVLEAKALHGECKGAPDPLQGGSTGVIWG
jgi:hypothetical protein